MFIVLWHKHFGIYKFIRELKLSCNFDDIYLDNSDINEEFILRNIPKDFLPIESNQIFLNIKGVRQHELKMFKNEGEYSNCYLINICEYSCLPL